MEFIKVVWVFDCIGSRFIFFVFIWFSLDEGVWIWSKDFFYFSCISILYVKRLNLVISFGFECGGIYVIVSNSYWFGIS